MDVEGEKSVVAEKWVPSGSGFVLWSRAGGEMKESREGLRAEANGSS